MIQRLTLLLLVTLALGAVPNNLTEFYTTQLGHKSGFNAYSGYQEINWYHPANTTGMFYQIFGAYGVDLNLPNDMPIILWLQGGPGASSQFGAYQEVGPVKIKKGVLGDNTWSWNLQAHLLFVDSPLNVGFSYSDKDRNGDDQVGSTSTAANHLVNFLHNFFVTWPSLKTNKLYIFGESFGGHYAPVLASKLLSNSSWSNRVEGMIIGDGWTDPINQINYYDTYLWSLGIIDRSFRETVTWFQTQSMVNMDILNFQKATDYFDFLTNNDTTAETHFGGISTFNFRDFDGMDASFVDWINNYKNELGGKVDYILSNQKVYTAFGPDITRSVAAYVVDVLKKVRVLIYNGQNDVVVNTPGVLHYLSSIDWVHIDEWKRTKKQIFTLGQQPSGWAKVFKNLWFVLINGAGHMVPTDKPQHSYHMLGKFLSNQNSWNM